jgi:uncharacterized protein YciI
MPAIRRTLYLEHVGLTNGSAAHLAQEEHAHDKALVEAGRLLLGGPAGEDAALYVLSAASLAEARALADERPTVRAGLARSTVSEWSILYEAQG